MSIASVISSMETNLSNAYDTISAKGGTLPANKNLQNLSTAIDSISGGASDNNPFYFTSTSAFSVSMNLTEADPSGTMQYSTNGSTWSNYSSGTTINGSAGGKIYFRGTNFTYFSKYASREATTPIFTLTGTSKIYVHGNILRLLDYLKVEDGDSVSIGMSSHCFQRLFYSQTLLDVANDFILPATTLATYSYNRMFYGCTSLTTAPNLPATGLASYCYDYMFYGCTSLRTAPNLPATTLAGYCYEYMFYGCTGLITAPTLPATEVGSYSYRSMFNRCTSLTTAPNLPATTLATYCYEDMFYGCTSLTTAPNLPATELTNYCYDYMFYGCTSLRTAPNLPATTLAGYCYRSMFYGCTGLITPAKIGDGTTSYTYKGYAMSNMYNGCSSLYIYTSAGSGRTAFFKGLSATSSSSMANMFKGCYLDGTLQSTGTGVVGQQYYY